MSDTTDRRHFLKTTIGAGLGAAVAGGAAGTEAAQSPGPQPAAGQKLLAAPPSIVCGLESSVSATRALRTCRTS